MRNELYHYGIKGMKWGIRRHRNNDARHRRPTSTSAGKARYGVKRNVVKTQESNSGNFNKANIQKRVYPNFVAYAYNSKNEQGKRNFDKLASRRHDSFEEISDRVTPSTQKAIRIFMQERNTDAGMEKATASLAKDLGDLNFNVQFVRHSDGYMQGMFRLVGNDYGYVSSFEDGHVQYEGLIDRRTNEFITEV
jgi:hypothetical protein